MLSVVQDQVQEVSFGIYQQMLRFILSKMRLKLGVSLRDEPWIW
jgi:hypothetical protein